MSDKNRGAWWKLPMLIVALPIVAIVAAAFMAAAFLEDVYETVWG